MFFEKLEKLAFSPQDGSRCGNYLREASRCMNPSSGQIAVENLSGDRIELAAVLAEHGRWLRTVLAARGVDRAALDDVMQAVCTAATQSIAGLNTPGRMGPWLYRIAVVQALQYRRRIGRRRRLIERYAAGGMAPSEAIDCDPLAWLMAEETQQLVRRAIASLPAQDAEMLLLKYTEDWSYRELAERLGISESAVEARLHRARGRMRTALAKLAPDLVPGR
jgi:RNA polymerase sigma factor (sigma-70 family)